MSWSKKNSQPHKTVHANKSNPNQCILILILIWKAITQRVGFSPVDSFPSISSHTAISIPYPIL